MNAVGIDVSKGKSMVAALWPMGEVALLPQEFLHTEVGLEQMAYAIIALGYTMVYGIAKMLNFAHGDVIMVGAYISFCVTQDMGLPALVSVVAAMAVCTLLGIVIERLAYKPLRQATSLAVLITAIGVSYFLQNAAQLLWTSNPKIFPSFLVDTQQNADGTQTVKSGIQFAGGQLSVSYATLITIAVCVVIMLVLTWFTEHTKMGQAIQACSEDKGAAQLMGINVNTTISLTFAIGSALAAIAGVLLCSAYPTLGPTTGSMPGSYPHLTLPPNREGMKLGVAG